MFDQIIESPSLPSRPDASNWTNTGSLSEEQALGALRRHCQNDCCWGEGPIDKMKIQSIDSTTGYTVKIPRLR